MIYFDLLPKVILFKQNSCCPFWILFVSRWTKSIIKKSCKCHLSIFPVMHRKEVIKKSFRGFETQSWLEVGKDRNSSYYAWYLTIVEPVIWINLIHFVSIFLKRSRSNFFSINEFPRTDIVKIGGNLFWFRRFKVRWNIKHSQLHIFDNKELEIAVDSCRGKILSD